MAEDSDVIVALIRTAFIIAFFAMRYVNPGILVPVHMLVVLFVAAAFTLLSFSLYLSGRSLHTQRPLALLVDLTLVSAAIAIFRREGQDLFDLYYLVVIAAAVWYRLYGAVAVATCAVALAAIAPHFTVGQYYPLNELLTTKLPLLLLIAIIAGYLMRARDAEHLAIVELRQEMRLARALQGQMLPDRLPALAGYDLGLVFSPARQVGGDFYDLRLLDDDHLLIVLADMSGKSVYGLVHLSLVYSHLQSAAREGRGPAEIATLVNRGAYDALQPESYAAIFIGVLRLSDGLLCFVNCGHMPPVRIRRRGIEGPDLLFTGGTVIGAIRDARYEERGVTLAPGDALVCFSDGITDTRNRKRELFGEERVAQFARQSLDLPAQEVAEELAKAVEKHADKPGQDDVTVMVVRRDEAGGKSEG
ncbi:MAG: PP2C family protein-serine/threonine phosphatase [Armatimonadota bacterium]